MHGHLRGWLCGGGLKGACMCALLPQGMALWRWAQRCVHVCIAASGVQAWPLQRCVRACMATSGYGFVAVGPKVRACQQIASFVALKLGGCGSFIWSLVLLSGLFFVRSGTEGGAQASTGPLTVISQLILPHLNPQALCSLLIMRPRLELPLQRGGCSILSSCRIQPKKPSQPPYRAAQLSSQQAGSNLFTPSPLT